jgi:hypothetical protein
MFVEQLFGVTLHVCEGRISFIWYLCPDLNTNLSLASTTLVTNTNASDAVRAWDLV